MLRNFLFEIAGCTSNFTVQNRQQTCINEIREKVDKSKVLVSETPRRQLDPKLGFISPGSPVSVWALSSSRLLILPSLNSGRHDCWADLY